MAWSPPKWDTGNFDFCRPGDYTPPAWDEAEFPLCPAETTWRGLEFAAAYREQQVWRGFEFAAAYKEGRGEGITFAAKYQGTTPGGFDFVAEYTDAWAGFTFDARYRGAVSVGHEFTGTYRASPGICLEFTAKYQSAWAAFVFTGTYGSATALGYVFDANYQSAAPRGSEFVANYHDAWIAYELGAKYQGTAVVGHEFIGTYQGAPLIRYEFIGRYRDAWVGSEFVGNYRGAQVLGDEFRASYRETYRQVSEFIGRYRDAWVGSEFIGKYQGTVWRALEFLGDYSDAWRAFEFASLYRRAGLLGAEFAANYRGLVSVGSEFYALYQGLVNVMKLGFELTGLYRGVLHLNHEFAAAYQAAYQQAVEFSARHMEAAADSYEFAATYNAPNPAGFEFLGGYREAIDTHPTCVEFLGQYTDRGLAGIEFAALYGETGEIPEIPEDGLSLTVGGVQLDPVHITITWSRDQSMIEVLLELATEEEWLVCTRHAAARLELWGYSFQLIVDTRERSEEYASQQWTVRLASPAVLLDFPWALSVEGQLAGQASVIARRLAGSIQVDWRCVDWLITPGVWTATGESPLALLQTLATTVGGVLLSQPDGSLLVQPQYAVSPPDWATAGPAATLSTVHDVVSFNLSDETTDGIDTVTVGDSAASDDELRLEEDSDKRRGGVTEVLVYQVPWRDNVTLTHRGDPATAAIYPLGLEERTITDEEIIIQAGEGRAAYPIYALMGARYNARNLGTCEFGEDGAIKTAVIDESILLLSYRTRARRYRVDERLLNDLLLVAADE